MSNLSKQCSFDLIEAVIKNKANQFKLSEADVNALVESVIYDVYKLIDNCLVDSISDFKKKKVS